MPLHYDLDLSFPLGSNVVTVTSRQTYRNSTGAALSELVLDAHDLKLLAVEAATGHRELGPPPSAASPKVPDFVAHVAELDAVKFVAAEHSYDAEKRKIVISFSPPIPAGGEVLLRTVSTCAPDDKNLEGIYFDYTPDGKPQTMISQCQQ